MRMSILEGWKNIESESLQVDGKSSTGGNQDLFSIPYWLPWPSLTTKSFFYLNNSGKHIFKGSLKELLQCLAEGASNPQANTLLIRPQWVDMDLNLKSLLQNQKWNFLDVVSNSAANSRQNGFFLSAQFENEKELAKDFADFLGILEQRVSLQNALNEILFFGRSLQAEPVSDSFLASMAMECKVKNYKLTVVSEKNFWRLGSLQSYEYISLDRYRWTPFSYVENFCLMKGAVTRRSQVSSVVDREYYPLSPYHGVIL